MGISRGNSRRWDGGIPKGGIGGQRGGLSENLSPIIGLHLSSIYIK